MQRSFHILGMGKYLPERRVYAAEIDEKLGLPPGTAFQKSGVNVRYYASGESVSDMGARACQRALDDAGLELSVIDALIYVGATREQGLPCNAIFIQRALGGNTSGIPCFDIDATCLSFLVGLDQATLSLWGQRFKRILLVSSEIASNHLNLEHIESAALFGDGALAWLISHEKDPQAKSEASVLLGSHMESHSEYIEVCGIKGGMSRMPAFHYTEERHSDYCFHMDGRRLFKATLQLAPPAMARFLDKVSVTLDEISWVVPHQASSSALELLRRRLGIEEEKFMCIIEDHGNQISASIPTGFYELARSGRLKKGQLVMLCGTGAGLGIGFTLLRY